MPFVPNKYFPILCVLVVCQVSSCGQAFPQGIDDTKRLQNAPQMLIVPKPPMNRGNSDVTVRPLVMNGGYRTLRVIEPFTRKSINHLELMLYTVKGAIEAPVPDQNSVQVKASIPQSLLDSAITFRHLQNDTIYRVRAFAFRDTSNDPDALISVNEQSYLDISVTNDDQPILGSLRVRLKDVAFDGRGAVNGIDISDGEVIGSPTPSPTTSAAPSASPVPSPSPMPTPSATPSTLPDTSGLGVEVIDVKTSGILFWKKVSVAGKVRNGGSVKCSGEVQVCFTNFGLVVETRVENVRSLAPGETHLFQMRSRKVANGVLVSLVRQELE